MVIFHFPAPAAYVESLVTLLLFLVLFLRLPDFYKQEPKYGHVADISVIPNSAFANYELRLDST